jgi:hypothetical protein
MSDQKSKGLYVDHNNDKYLGDLGLLNTRKHAWNNMHPKFRMYRAIVFIVFGLGCVGIYFAFMATKDATTTKGILPLHFSIWITGILTILAHHFTKKYYEKPFGSLHSARFEAAPKGLYYIYQQGMKLITYYIKDKDIREIIRDDEANCLYIKGKGMLEVNMRNELHSHSINGIYAMVAFDEYDLDDLLEPYGDLVKVAPGTLRNQYLSEGSDQ